VSFRVDDTLCIGCGACDFSCPTGALEKTDSFLGLFRIDPFTCDDCGICTGKCPERASGPDPEWPVCQDRGCPLHSKRLAEYGCAIWQKQCVHYGTTIWTSPEGVEGRPRCDFGMSVSCPNSNQIDDQLFPRRSTIRASDQSG